MNTAIGGFAAYKAGPFQNAAAGSYVLFRKAWMKLPIRLATFGAAYYTANQIQTRFFPRAHFSYWREGGQKSAIYLANQELISKFRIFDGDNAQADAKTEIENYLDVYTSGPLTKAEMLNRIRDGRTVDERFAKNFRVKRGGKDKDDLFWSLGKIHGLENIALLDEDTVSSAAGDPWRLQQLVNDANDNEKPLPAQNFDRLVEEIHQGMNTYKGHLDSNKKEYYPSDRKKLLALPFLLSKRTELPSPKKGQSDWNLFKQLYGSEWDRFESLMFDEEDKITEFNYEKFIPKHLLSQMDTQSQEFKNLIRVMHMNQLTEYEQHRQNQEQF